MSGREIAGILGVIGFIGFAALLAMAETGLSYLSRARARTLVDDDRPGSQQLVRLLERREFVLNQILFLLLAFNVAAAMLTGAIVQNRFGNSWVPLALVVIVVVIYLFAYALPRSWALHDIDRAALRSAGPIDKLSRFPPLRWLTSLLLRFARTSLPGSGSRALGPTVSEEELLALLGVAEEADVIDTEERKIMASIINFGDTIVREVMVPRTDMVTVEATFRGADAVEVSLLNGYSRFPVTGEGVDDIVGIVHAKDLMRAEHDARSSRAVSSMMRRPLFVPESKLVSELLAEMRQEKFHLAIVVDEYGGTAGLVTLEDLIEELVGEIADEFDREDPKVEHLEEGRVRVSARMPIDEVNEIVGADFPEGDWDTVGGLLFDALGHVPVEGETVVVDGYRLRADRVAGRRIDRVYIEAGGS